jgi:carboxypeptidase C (cathepsin A)
MKIHLVGLLVLVLTVSWCQAGFNFERRTSKANPKTHFASRDGTSLPLSSLLLVSYSSLLFVSFDFFHIYISYFPPVNPPIQPGANGVNHLIDWSEFPGLPAYNSRSWAGYITVNNTGNHETNFFYWLFESQSATPSTDPLIVWMQGGPGCTSFDGALWENISPFVFRKGDADCNIDSNPHAWNKNANLLFLDQPANTGLSYGADLINYAGDIDGGLSEAANQFRSFLLKFFGCYPNLKTRKLFLSGESFGGQYIPFYALTLLANQNADGTKLTGVSIGNGWVDSGSHYLSYPQYAYGLGFITAGQKRELETRYKACLKDIDRVLTGKQDWVDTCDTLRDDVVGSSGQDESHFFNLYDIRRQELSATFPAPQLQCMEAYVNRPEVLSALNAETFPGTFSECTTNQAVYDALVIRFVASTVNQIATLLNRKVPVLLYSGQYDFIVNHIGTDNWIDGITAHQWPAIDRVRALFFCFFSSYCFPSSHLLIPSPTALHFLYQLPHSSFLLRELFLLPR